jgi:hypothetical protein
VLALLPGRRQAVADKAEALKRLRGELSQAKERAEQVQMEKERKVRLPRLTCPCLSVVLFVIQQACMCTFSWAKLTLCRLTCPCTYRL